MQYQVDTRPRSVLTHEYLKPFERDGVCILDVGSRDGAAFDRVRAQVTPGRLVALDLHHRVENGVEFLSHDLEQPLPFEDNSFDCIVCTDVLEHVERKQQLARELARVSRKGVIVSLPNTQHYSYIKGLKRGNMGKQYRFDVEDGSDRHRWITYYKTNTDFVASHFTITAQHDICKRGWHAPLARILPARYTINQFYACTV